MNQEALQAIRRPLRDADSSVSSFQFFEVPLGKLFAFVFVVVLASIALDILGLAVKTFWIKEPGQGRYRVED